MTTSKAGNRAWRHGALYWRRDCWHWHLLSHAWTGGFSRCCLSQFLLRKLDNRDLLSPLLRRLSVVLVIQIPFVAAFTLVDTASAGYWFYACEVVTFSVLTTFMVIPIWLAVPNRMRGQTTGFFLMSTYLVGASLTSEAVGALSDRIKSNPHGLLTAFVIVLCISSVFSATLMYLSSMKRSVANEADSVRANAMPSNS